MPQRPARLTVVESVYHQPEGEEATCATSRYADWLKSEDQPYSRRGIKVGVAWQSLDLGWIKEPSLLVVENTGKEILTLGIGEPPRPFAWIGPSHTARFAPLGSLAIDCPNGETTYSITVFPT